MEAKLFSLSEEWHTSLVCKYLSLLCMLFTFSDIFQIVALLIFETSNFKNVYGILV